MPYNTEYRDSIPASKTERLQPKFLRKESANGTPGEIAVKGPNGLKIRQTSSGCVYPDERGRRSRIGLPDRFNKGD